jgi:hypothetical protein
MKKNKISNLLSAVLLYFSVTIVLSQGSLEDIRNKLNKGKNLTHIDIHASKPAENPEQKENPEQAADKKFEIKSLKTGKMNGWKTTNNKGAYALLYGITASFKVNEKGESINVPVNFCYFYDKDKNLIERKKASFILGRGKARGTEIEGDLNVEGQDTVQIAFTYPADFRYKYAVCVIGDETGMDVACIPNSASPKDFEFDEKNQIFKQ